MFVRELAIELTSDFMNVLWSRWGMTACQGGVASDPDINDCIAETYLMGGVRSIEMFDKRKSVSRHLSDDNFTSPVRCHISLGTRATHL